MLVSDFFETYSDLIRRFGCNYADYRLYPEIGYFVEACDAHAYSAWLGHCKTRRFCRSLTVNIHAPFCHLLHFYSPHFDQDVSNNSDSAKKYHDYLLREIKLYSQLLTDPPIVEQLYVGGASNFLSYAQLNSVIQEIQQNFTLMKEGKLCIEIDSKQMSESSLQALREMGFNCVVIGMQDFDQGTQQPLHSSRIEASPLCAIRNAHQAGFKTIKIELFYGLPKQNLEKFAHILEKIITANPHQISLLNYFYRLDKVKLQRNINLEDLPCEEVRLEMRLFAMIRLTEVGYVYIGMGLFAKYSDPLVVAKHQGRLHYGLQGYSISSDSCCIALGISGIGNIGPMLSQNACDFVNYYSKLERNMLPIMRCITLSGDDLIRRSVMQALICHSVLSIESVETFFPIEFKNYFAMELAELVTYAQAELITLDDEQITVTPKGWLLINNICGVFDKYLRTRK